MILRLFRLHNNELHFEMVWWRLILNKSQGFRVCTNEYEWQGVWVRNQGWRSQKKQEGIWEKSMGVMMMYLTSP